MILVDNQSGNPKKTNLNIEFDIVNGVSTHSRVIVILTRDLRSRLYKGVNR